MITARVGAPVTLSVMVVSWGIVAASTAAVKTVNQFYALRFLLGLCEAGTHRPLHQANRPHIPMLFPTVPVLIQIAGSFFKWEDLLERKLPVYHTNHIPGPPTSASQLTSSAWPISVGKLTCPCAQACSLPASSTCRCSSARGSCRWRMPSCSPPSAAHRWSGGPLQGVCSTSLQAACTASSGCSSLRESSL